MKEPSRREHSKQMSRGVINAFSWAIYFKDFSCCLGFVLNVFNRCIMIQISYRVATRSTMKFHQDLHPDKRLTPCNLLSYTLTATLRYFASTGGRTSLQRTWVVQSLKEAPFPTHLIVEKAGWLFHAKVYASSTIRLVNAQVKQKLR